MACHWPVHLAQAFPLPSGDVIMQIKCVGRLARVVAIVGVMLAHSASAQTTGACNDSSTAIAKGYRDYYGAFVSVTDTQVVRVRNQLGLPTLSNSQVRIVSDTTVCRVASQAYDATLEVPYPNARVVVLEVGTKRLVVKDIGFKEFMLNLLFDQGFTTLLQRIWH